MKKVKKDIQTCSLSILQDFYTGSLDDRPTNCVILFKIPLDQINLELLQICLNVSQKLQVMGLQPINVTLYIMVFRNTSDCIDTSCLL